MGLRSFVASSPSPATAAPGAASTGRQSQPQPLRRADDTTLRVLTVARTESGSSEAVPGLPSEGGSGWVEYEVSDRAHGSLHPRPEPRLEADDATVLLDCDGSDALFLTGAVVRRLPRGGGGPELLARAAAGAVTWRRERIRERKRQDLAEQLIAFWQQLNTAVTSREVYDALLRHAVRVVGAYTATLFVPSEDGSALQSVDMPQDGEGSGQRFTLQAHPRFHRPGLIRACDAQPNTGSPFSGLSSFFLTTGAATLAYVPCGRGGILLLAERRRERVFEPEDWSLIGTLASQAETALERIELFAEVRELSLTEPLTGLANRRHLEVVMHRWWLAAKRGEPLAALMLDIDGFKTFNDTRGHVEGDRLLRLVADHLRQVIRGADLAVRYGGDEFMLLLPGTDVAGARSVLHRLRERLAGQIEFSAGAAEYHSGMSSPDELIAAADRQLYKSKRSRNGRGGPSGDPGDP